MDAVRLSLIALLSMAPLLLVACDKEERAAPATPTAPPTSTLTVESTPVVLPSPVPLEEGALITEGGFYVSEVGTQRLWKIGDRPGSWSPDGKTLIFAGCCVGTGGIDLLHVESGLAERIFTGDVAGVAWSPDGNQVAFSRFANGPQGLYVMNANGSGLRQLSDGGTWNPKWSPRGDRIAFQPPGQADVYLLDLSSGEITGIANSPGPDAWFAWSPAGESLAFADETGLYIYDLDAGSRRQLTHGPSAGPIWSPDGSRIALYYGPRLPFAHDQQAGNQVPHLIQVQGSAEPRPLPPARNLSWSPDGTQLAYLSEGCITREWDVYTIGAGGTAPQRLTNTPDVLKEGPYWSPDGSALVFSLFDLSAGSKLVLVDTSSQELRTLAVSGPPGSAPGFHLDGDVWSADGRYVSFFADGGHGVCD